MPVNDPQDAAVMAGLAGVAGGAARVLVELHGGERRPVALIIDAALGVVLGIMFAGIAVWIDANLQSSGWPFLIVGGGAGCVGAIGTRTLDIITEALRKRLGG